MPRQKSATLTDAELRLMDVLWTLGPASVSDVADALPKDQPLAYSSVLTTLRILEQKGYVKHKQSGRAFVYHPVVDRTQARRSAVRHLLGRLFDGSPQLLMQSLLEDKTLTAAERRRLRGLIQRMD